MRTAQPLRHFIDIEHLDKETLLGIIRQGHLYKKQSHATIDILKGKELALIFEKPSTRTRVSFEVAMHELGGHVTSLTGKEMQLGHGESLADTARVMSRFVSAMVIRTFEHADMEEFAKYSTVPIINGLTNQSHPCQVIADLMMVEERLRRLSNFTVAWCGDGDNNVLNSWMQAAGILGFEVRIACPDAYSPVPELLERYQQRANISIAPTIEDAVSGANVVITDTWISMHHTDADERREIFQDYQVNSAVMALAHHEAIFMHCLPAHRGEEVTDAVMDGAQSVVFDEAENRLHAQKAILMWCFNILLRGT
jgi:ornithine carbamoyltransferase